MSIKLFSFLLIVIITLSSCNNKKPRLTEDYKLYNLQQQGWKSKKITNFIGDINYTATEVPLQYYLLKNSGEKINKIDSLYNLNKRERVIEVEFQHIDKADLLLEEYTNRSYEDAVKYMAFSVENDFTIVTSSNDTIICSGAHFERNFKVAPFKRALLYFNNINPNDNIKLLYQDHLFGNGIITFNFKETPIKI